MFTPSKMLLNYMNAQPKDMFDIIGALMGYINADPRFKTNDFESAVKYVLENGVDEDELFSEFDESIDFEVNPDKWNEEYYSFARVYLKDNFCKKRIEHVKAVARKLYPSITPQSTPTPIIHTQRPTSEQIGGNQSAGKKSQSQQSHKGNRVSGKVIVAGIVVLLALIVILIVVNKR